MADESKKSFIENVNIIANATQLATGDVIEDAENAKNEAEASAVKALESENNAKDSELLSQEWAAKAFNADVDNIPGQRSSYHWSIIAAQNAGVNLIDDNVTSLTYTWSSQKIYDISLSKSDIGHTHVDKENAFSKNSAFNKSFNTNGIATTVSRSDHTHSEYENSIGTKNTAFNKNFGINSGEVSEGDHNHDSSYMAKAAIQTAYNKPFVLNSSNPGSEEVPRGTHIHSAAKTTHDPSGNSVALSTTVQGAIGQLDSVLSTVSAAEKSKLIGGMTDNTYVITIAAADTPVIVNAGMTLGSSVKNADYSNGTRVKYVEDPDKLVEGQYDVTMSIEAEANTTYGISLTVNGAVINTAVRAIVGSATSPAGTYALSLSGWISNLENLDVVGVAMYNLTNSNNVTINSMTVSWAGQPEGALVASGISVDHAELTGTGAANGVHTTSDIQDLDTELLAKADKVVGATDGNMASLDTNGNIVDSGYALADVSSHMLKVAVPTLDNIITQTSSGDSKDGGVKISELALVAGSSAQAFEVATPATDTQAVTKLMFDTEKALTATTQDLTDHTALVNPHATAYTDVGAAASVHTHAEGDVIGLTDALNSKYSLVSSPATDNLVVFETGNLLQDSGIAYSNILQTTGGTMTGVLEIDDSSHIFFNTITDWFISASATFNIKANTSNSDTGLTIDPNSADIIMNYQGITINDKKVVVEDAYATDTVGGTIKIKVVGSDCYITTNETTPGA